MTRSRTGATVSSSSKNTRKCTGWLLITDGDTILYIGAENWPFPIPLVSKDGVWRFDPAAGQQEVLLRQIGENEVTAMDTCHDLVLAEEQSGTLDKTDSATTTLLAELEHSKGPVLVGAYNFRILTARARRHKAKRRLAGSPSSPIPPCTDC